MSVRLFSYVFVQIDPIFSITYFAVCPSLHYPRPPPQKYHLPTLGSSEANAEQHRRDMELHRLNAEPRMMLEAEAWSNLNVGGGADLDSSTLVGGVPYIWYSSNLGLMAVKLACHVL